MRILVLTLSLSAGAHASALNDQPIWQTGISTVTIPDRPVPRDRPSWTFPALREEVGATSAFVRGEPTPSQAPAISGGTILPSVTIRDQPQWNRAAPASTQNVTGAASPPAPVLSTRSDQAAGVSIPTALRAQPVWNQTSQGEPRPAPQTRAQVSRPPTPAPAARSNPAGTPQSALRATSIPAQGPTTTTDPNHLSGSVPGPWAGGAPKLTLQEGGGISRLQMQLPPGTRWSLRPRSNGFELNLTGNWAATSVATAQWKRTGEVSDLIVLAMPGGWTAQIATAAPVRERGSWRVITPQGPQIGGGGLIALDLSPALGERRPLHPADLQIKAQAPARPIFVTLDPGHGGHDPGANGLVREEDVVLDVARRTAGFLRAWGVQVKLTRDGDYALSENKANDLWLRSQAGRGQHAFVSIHANAMPAQNILKGYGTETWYMGRNAGFAGLLQEEMSAVSGSKNLGIKSRTLGVLSTNPAPAALVEIGFVSHPVDGENLTSNNYLSRVSLGIARGVLRQVGLTVPPISTLPIKPEPVLSPLPPMPALPPALPTLPIQTPLITPTSRPGISIPAPLSPPIPKRETEQQKTGRQTETEHSSQHETTALRSADQ